MLDILAWKDNMALTIGYLCDCNDCVQDGYPCCDQDNCNINVTNISWCQITCHSPYVRSPGSVWPTDSRGGGGGGEACK